MKSKYKKDFTLVLLTGVGKYWLIGLLTLCLFWIIGGIDNRNNLSQQCAVPPIWMWLPMIIIFLLCVFVTMIVLSIREKCITIPSESGYRHGHGEILVRLSADGAIEEAVEGRPIWGIVGSGSNRVIRIFEILDPKIERKEEVEIIVSQKEGLSTISFLLCFSFKCHEFQDYKWLEKIIKENRNNLNDLFRAKALDAVDAFSTEIKLEIKKFRDKVIVLEKVQENILKIIQKQDLFFKLGLIKEVSVYVGQPTVSARLIVS